MTGLPTVVRTDEGTAFTSGDFKEYLASLFIRHTFSAPYNHSANGGAEKAVGLVKGILKKSGWKGLQKGLLSLNSTVKQDMTGSISTYFLEDQRRICCQEAEPEGFHRKNSGIKDWPSSRR